MKVKLKDSIISELTALGICPGDVIESSDITKTTGALHFTVHLHGSPYNCVVWPEDYEVMEDETGAALPEVADWVDQVSKEIPDQLTLPMTEVTDALDAMYWCFAPFLGNSDLSESPWIENLI